MKIHNSSIKKNKKILMSCTRLDNLISQKRNYNVSQSKLIVNIVEIFNANKNVNHLLLKKEVKAKDVKNFLRLQIRKVFKLKKIHLMSSNRLRKNYKLQIIQITSMNRLSEGLCLVYLVKKCCKDSPQFFHRIKKYS